tara:strand:- start:1730 stop:2521 length:792 start_codon:yes stop_codon:yes gene_type:complete
MYRFDKLDVSNNTFEHIIQTQLSNKSIIREHFIGSRRNLYSKNKLIATTMQNQGVPLMIGNISKKQFTSFLGTFSKNLYSQIKKSPELLSVHIDFNKPSRGKNIKVWDGMKTGEYMYNLDLSSAYWQVAHKLGYISTSFFENYVHSNEFKMAKRLCISFLSRRNEMLYHVDDSSYTIKCDITALRRIYENIRYYLYNIVAEVVEMCPDWIEYNIDGVTVKNSEVDKIQNYFNNEKLLFKIKECRKLNETEYVYGNTIRKFKNI